MACPAPWAGARWRSVALAALTVWVGAAWGQGSPINILVQTNKDLSDPNDGLVSLREAITQANAVDPALGQVVISLDPNYFQAIPAYQSWTHEQYSAGPPQQGHYYDTQGFSPANDPNRIVVATPELMGEPGFPTMQGVPTQFPLPGLFRSNTTLNGDINNDGIPDLRIDMGELPYVYPTMFGMQRSYGLGISAATNVVIQGVDIRFGMPHPTPSVSPPMVWIVSGSNHRVLTCWIERSAIGVETIVAAGNEVVIGGISAGSRNRIVQHSYAGVFCKGAGTTTIQQNTIQACGRASDTVDQFSGGIIIDQASSGANVIGGTVSGAGNTISGNVTHGIIIRGTGANRVEGNTISSNSRSGIWIEGSGSNIIGGSASLSGNTISSNGLSAGTWNHAGVYILGGGANVIQGNTFDGNGGAGIYIAGGVLGAAGNQIGGTATAARNVIINNGALSTAESLSGIDIRGDSNNIVENNYIGVQDNADSSPAPNAGHGISISDTADGNNRIGGTQSASRNVIGSNGLNGIRLDGSGDNTIGGNYIGVGANGTADRGNSVSGMEISASTSGTNIIGGTSNAERNVISGNGNDGITINSVGPNFLYGNYIGVDATGTARLANGRHGVAITSQARGINTIGGRAPGQRNVISGNGGFGISIEGSPGAASNVIRGNYIGIGADAANAFGNGAGGIGVNAPVAQIIGGSQLGDGNIISGNTGANADGIELLGAGPHVVVGNVIGAVPYDTSRFPQDPRLVIENQFRNGGAGILVGGGATGAITIGYDPTDGTPNDNRFEGNVIVNNGAEGIHLAGTGNVTVVNNWIGVGLSSAGPINSSPDGGSLRAMPNHDDGILISGSGNNQIGDNEESPDLPNTKFYNVISGNGGNGISITGSGNNNVVRNRIGTNIGSSTANLCDVAIPNGDSTAVAATDNGVAITGTGTNTLRNNTISGNANNGVYMFGTGTYRLFGNSIGVNGIDRSGDTAVPNGNHGIFVPDNAPGFLELGGPVTADLNVISGNAGDGVHIEGNVTNDIEGNLIGTNGQRTVGGVTTRGDAAVPNGNDGVYLQGTPTTATELTANTISGNTRYGVFIRSGANKLYKNQIGTNAAGTAAVGNNSHGIYINDPNLPTERAGQEIGRLATGAIRQGNIIAGNGGDGIRIAQAGGNDSATTADDILIRTNFIGLDSTGTNAIPNSGNGIYVESGCEGKIQIGGLINGEGNIICASGEWGIRFDAEYGHNPATGILNAPLIYGNWIGINQQGAQPSGLLRNASGGIYVNVDAGGDPSNPRTVLIGDDGSGIGRQPYAGGRRPTNIISGNGGDAIRVDGTSGTPSANVTVVGCFIGTDDFGTNVIGNSGSGVALTGNVTGTVLIGVTNVDFTAADPSVSGDLGTIEANDLDDRDGNSATADNLAKFRCVIAGNGGYGVSSSSIGNLVVANCHIGAREGTTTTVPLTFGSGGGNAFGGIRVAGGSAAGLAILDNNYVFRSGGSDSGVSVSAAGQVVLDQNRVRYSTGTGINLDGGGTYSVTNCTISDNGGDGVKIGATTATSGAVVGSSSVAKTGAAAQTGYNIIADNAGHGINQVSGSDNRLSANRISGNGVVSGTYNGSSLPIDRGNDGANVPAAVTLDRLRKNNAGQWVISGRMPTGSAAIEIYEAADPDTVADASLLKHRGQVRQFLARLTEDNDADTAADNFNATAGTFTYTTGAALQAPAGQELITAIAIDDAGNTSEFARNIGQVVLTNSLIAVTPSSIRADGSQTATATATIRDFINTPLPGVPQVQITTTPTPSSLTFTQTSTTTGAAGTVTATLRADGRDSCADATIAIGAEVSGAPLTLPPPAPANTRRTVPLSLIVGTASPRDSSIELTNPAPPGNVTANGTSKATLTITVRDSSSDHCQVGGLDPSRIQVFEVDSKSGVTITGPTQPTNANGQCTVSVTSTVADTFTFGFSVDRTGDGFDAGDQARDAQGNLITVSVTFVPGTVSAAQSTFTANPTQVQANGTTPSTLELTARDSEGNLVSGIPTAEILVTPSPAAGVQPSPIAMTEVPGQPGVYRADVTGSVPGIVTFVATARGVVITQTAVVNFTVGQASGNSRLTAEPLQARPNGSDTILLTASVRDDSPNGGNPIPNVDVTITATTGQGVVVTGPTRPTDANGITTATVTATQAGVVILTATALVDGTPTTVGTVRVEFRLLDPSPTLSSLTVQTDDPLLANGQRAATVTVRLVDALGDPLPGVRPDEFQIGVTRQVASGVSVSGPNDATDSDGETTFRVVSSEPGRVTISVTARDVRLNQTVQVEFLPSITQTYGPGLHLMGIAGTPRQPDPRYVLSALMPNLRLARWDQSTQSYRVWSEFSPTAPFAMTAGRGFWLQLDSLVSFTAVGEPTPAGSFTLPLAQGWNQVANPFATPFNFTLADITVLQNGAPVGSLATEAARALVEPYGWRWDPVLMYLLLIDPSTAGAQTVSGQVGVGRGWWWLCRGSNVSVVLQSSASRSRIVRAAPTPGSWLATLDATTADGQAQALFGAGAGRMRAELPPDAPQAPTVKVEFVDELGRAASDVRRGPLTAATRWRAAVTTATPGEVTLSWQGLGRALPEHHKLWLTDLQSGKRVLMNSRAGYTYQGDGGARQFELTLDPHGARRLNIVDMTVGQTRGRGRGVPVTLTLTAPAELEMTVRGVGGRLVRQMSLSGAEGANTLTWDGRDQQGRPVPAGTYMIEVTAHTAEGEVARTVRSTTVR